MIEGGLWRAGRKAHGHRFFSSPCHARSLVFSLPSHHPLRTQLTRRLQRRSIHSLEPFTLPAQSGACSAKKFSCLPAAGRLPHVSRPSQKALTRFTHSVHTPFRILLQHYTVGVLAHTTRLQYNYSTLTIAKRLTKTQR